MINRLIFILFLIFRLTMTTDIAAIEVNKEYVKLSKEEVKDIVISFLKENIPWNEEKVKITYRGTEEEILLPKGEIRYDISARPSNLLGKVSVVVAFYVDGKLEKRIWAKAYVKVLDEVVVSTRPLAMRQRIKEKDIELVKADLTRIPADAIRDPKEVLGKRIKRPIDANEPLRMGLVESPPLVRRGSVVTIVIESKLLKVTTLGVVKEEGRRGQLVKVVNISSGKEIYAKVIDSNTVEVFF